MLRCPIVVQYPIVINGDNPCQLAFPGEQLNGEDVLTFEFEHCSDTCNAELVLKLLKLCNGARSHEEILACFPEAMQLDIDDALVDFADKGITRYPHELGLSPVPVVVLVSSLGIPVDEMVWGLWDELAVPRGTMSRLQVRRREESALLIARVITTHPVEWPDNPWLWPQLGFGAHTHPAEAALRALAEGFERKCCWNAQTITQRLVRTRPSESLLRVISPHDITRHHRERRGEQWSDYSG